jgi:hypothetical protein
MKLKYYEFKLIDFEFLSRRYSIVPFFGSVTTTKSYTHNKRAALLYVLWLHLSLPEDVHAPLSSGEREL